LHELQTAQLHNQQEQALSSGPHRVEEILSVLQFPYGSSRNAVISGGAVVSFLARLKQSFGSTFSFFGEAFAELKKVKWPTRKELTSYTLVVLFACIFVTVYFYVLDLGISNVIRAIFE
jgi:preprotein translocase subunit SecE